MNDHAILSLEAPIMRVAGSDSVFQFSQAETVWIPIHNNIIERVKEGIAV